MTKAKRLKQQEIRFERQEKFGRLDVAMNRAIEDDDENEKTRVRNLKQRMREAPSDPAIEAATDPETLKAVRPSILDEV
jgi:hypothetical protein